MNTLKDIENKLVANKKGLFQKYPIKSIALFGSFAREDHDEKSDIDILIDFTGNIGIQFIDLANEFEKLLGSKVDLVTRNGIEDKYFKAIQKDLVYV